MTSDVPKERRVSFYRAWSSEAAEQALASDHPGARTRCAHSASMWTLIADAMEAGLAGEVKLLTNNLLLLNNGCFVAANDAETN